VKFLTGSCCDLAAALPTRAMDSALHVFASIIRRQQSTLAVLNFLRSFPVTFYVKGLDVQIALQIVSYIFSKIIWCKCFKFTASSSFLKRHQDTVLSILHARYQFSPNFLPFFYTSIDTDILVLFST